MIEKEGEIREGTKWMEKDFHFDSAQVYIATGKPVKRATVSTF